MQAKVTKCMDPIQYTMGIQRRYAHRNVHKSDGVGELVVIQGPAPKDYNAINYSHLFIFGEKEPKKYPISTLIITYGSMSNEKLKVAIYHKKYKAICTDYFIFVLHLLFPEAPHTTFSTSEIGVAIIDCSRFELSNLTSDKKKEIETLVIKYIKLHRHGAIYTLSHFEGLHFKVKYNAVHNYITFAISGALEVVPWMTSKHLREILESIYPDMCRYDGGFIDTDPELYIGCFDTQAAANDSISVHIDADKVFDNNTGVFEKIEKFFNYTIDEIAKQVASAIGYLHTQYKFDDILATICEDISGEDSDDNKSFERTHMIGPLFKVVANYKSGSDYMALRIEGVDNIQDLGELIADQLSEYYNYLEVNNSFTSNPNCLDVHESDIYSCSSVLCIYVTLFQFDGEASFFTQLEIERIANAIFLDSKVQSYLASSDMQEKSDTQLLLDGGKDFDNTTIVDTTIVDTTIVDTTIIDTTIIDTTIVDTTIIDTTISKASGNKRGRDDAELMPPPKKLSSSYDDIGDPNFDWVWYAKNFALLFDN